MKFSLFKVLRFVTFAGLVALLAVRICCAPAPKLFFFLALVLFWFVTTLIWVGARGTAVRSMLRHDAVFAAVDGYLLLTATAAALAGVWNRPVLLLGAFVFSVGLFCDPLAGAAAAVTAFFGLLNGWLFPTGDLRLKSILLGGGTTLAALACGFAWRVSLPLLVRMVRSAVTGEADQPALPVLPIAERIAAMEVRLREMSVERDRAQERLSEWEAKQADRTAGASSLEEKGAPEPAHPAVVAPVTDDPALQARIDQVTAAVTDSRAERAVLLAEKQKLMDEISDLKKDLKSVQASIPVANTPATAPGGASHANG